MLDLRRFHRAESFQGKEFHPVSAGGTEHCIGPEEGDAQLLRPNQLAAGVAFSDMDRLEEGIRKQS
jgi:hypothetical protein